MISYAVKNQRDYSISVRLENRQNSFDCFIDSEDIVCFKRNESASAESMLNVDSILRLHAIFNGFRQDCVYVQAQSLGIT